MLALYSANTHHCDALLVTSTFCRSYPGLTTEVIPNVVITIVGQELGSSQFSFLTPSHTSGPVDLVLFPPPVLGVWVHFALGWRRNEVIRSLVLTREPG